MKTFVAPFALLLLLAGFTGDEIVPPNYNGKPFQDALTQQALSQSLAASKPHSTTWVAKESPITTRIRSTTAAAS
jgi:hypothetical protein